MGCNIAVVAHIIHHMSHTEKKKQCQKNKHIVISKTKIIKHLAVHSVAGSWNGGLDCDWSGKKKMNNNDIINLSQYMNIQQKHFD